MIWLQRRTLIIYCFGILFSSTNQPLLPAFLLLTRPHSVLGNQLSSPGWYLYWEMPFCHARRPTQIRGARTSVMGVLWLPMEVIGIYQRIYQRGKPHVFGWPRNFLCSFIFSGKPSSLLYGWFRFSDLQYLPGTCGSHCQPQWQLKGSGGLGSPPAADLSSQRPELHKAALRGRFPPHPFHALYQRQIKTAIWPSLLPCDFNVP